MLLSILPPATAVRCVIYTEVTVLSQLPLLHLPNISFAKIEKPAKQKLVYDICRYVDTVHVWSAQLDSLTV